MTDSSNKSKLEIKFCKEKERKEFLTFFVCVSLNTETAKDKNSGHCYS